jgi:hypothetical protein
VEHLLVDIQTLRSKGVNILYKSSSFVLEGGDTPGELGIEQFDTKLKIAESVSLYERC